MYEQDQFSSYCRIEANKLDDSMERYLYSSDETYYLGNKALVTNAFFLCHSLSTYIGYASFDLGSYC